MELDIIVLSFDGTIVFRLCLMVPFVLYKYYHIIILSTLKLWTLSRY